jgi:hypothetical protein
LALTVVAFPKYEQQPSCFASGSLVEFLADHPGALPLNLGTFLAYPA